MTRHELKCWPGQFAAIRDGAKNFEIRRDDRQFAIGDILVLKEFDQGSETFTGQVEERQILEYRSEALWSPVHPYVYLAFGPVRREGALPAGVMMTAGELAQWHDRRAGDAELRAGNARQTADEYARSPQTANSAARFDSVADLALEEAVFHSAAANLVGDLQSRLGEQPL